MAQTIDTPFPIFLNEDSTVVAQKLLGCYLVRDIGEREIIVRIVETESYDQSDAASHSFNGQTPRTDVMFGESGHVYVYFTYGMHYCCNVVTGSIGEGSAVLIRAVEPVEGKDYIEKHRGINGPQATNGPAKVCQALNIDKELNGHSLKYAPLRLVTGVQLDPEDIITTPRVGISKAVDAMRRFYIRDNRYVSKPAKKLIQGASS